jgi:hypothetical protein
MTKTTPTKPPLLFERLKLPDNGRWRIVEHVGTTIALIGAESAKRIAMETVVTHDEEPNPADILVKRILLRRFIYSERHHAQSANQRK